MAKKFSLALCVASLAGCGSPDGYTFGDKEFERNRPGIEIVTHDSVESLRRAFPASGRVEDGDDLMAWSVIREDGCTVHIVDPDVSYQPEWIGHEVAHCVWGRWHK